MTSDGFVQLNELSTVDHMEAVASTLHSLLEDRRSFTIDDQLEAATRLAYQLYVALEALEERRSLHALAKAV